MEKFGPLIIGCVLTGVSAFFASHYANRETVATLKQSLSDAHARLSKVEEKQDHQVERIHDQLNSLQEAVAGVERLLEYKFKP